MNQTLIHLIGKLDEDKKACWSKHLPELLMAYNSTCLAVTGYSPHFLLFGRRPRIPVDYLFPTLRDTPHKSELEESVALHQKRLKEAFAMAKKKLQDNNAIIITEPGPLPYSLGTLSWSTLTGLWASTR